MTRANFKIECANCLNLWDDDELVTKHDRGDRFTPPSSEDFCPECNSTTLDKVLMCLSCGDEKADTGSDNCAACDAAIDAEEGQ